MAIDYRRFIHPLDAKAMAAMEKIPGFKTVTDAFLKFYDDKVLHNLNMATCVRVGPRQLPRVYDMLREVCDKLEMEEPELYLENGRKEARSLGDAKPYIVIQSGVLSGLEEIEIKSVLAHLCGHILCHHNRYETMLMVAYEIGIAQFGPALLVKPVFWAIQTWMRYAGLTADRIDAWVMGSCDIVISKLMKLYGGIIYNHPGFELNAEAYMEQVEDFQIEREMSQANRLMEKWLVRNRGNAFGAIRCAELKKWWAGQHGTDERSLPPAETGGMSW